METIKERMYLPPDVKEIASIFMENGYDIFVVGGAVRDYVIGHEPKDYDLVTNAQPSSIIKILEGKYRLGLQGRHFAVVRVYTRQTPEGIEIASYRKDKSKGRDNKVDTNNPKVEYGNHITIRDDVLRRDLTCNALYYDIRREKIVDIVGGLNDLREGRIKAVGNPRLRFQEDRLRLLRAFRFTARMNYKIDEETSKAIEADNRLNGISYEDDVTQERINEEFNSMLKWCIDHNNLEAWLRYLNLLKEYKMFVRMYPGIKITTKTFYETLDEKIIYTRLFDRNNPSQKFHKKLIMEFRLPNRISDAVIFLLKIKETFNDKNIGNIFNYENKLFNIVMFYRNKIDYDISNETIIEYGKFANIDYKFINAFVNYEVTTDAKDLMSKGFKGKKLGHEIKRVETEKFKNLLTESINIDDEEIWEEEDDNDKEILYPYDELEIGDIVKLIDRKMNVEKTGRLFEITAQTKNDNLYSFKSLTKDGIPTFNFNTSYIRKFKKVFKQ